MYGFLLATHNILRWVVIFSAVWALIVSFRGLFSRTAWTDGDRRAGLIFSSSLNVQLVIGIILYVVSPLIQGAMQNMSAAMQNSAIRFFVAEHFVMMILAAIVAQVGYSMAKRAPTDRAKFMRSAIAYSIATLLILAGIPWPGMGAHGRPLLPF